MNLVEYKDYYRSFWLLMRVIRKSLPHQKNPKFCGISIKRDTLAFQVRELGAVPKFRSTRRTCILIEHLIYELGLLSVPPGSLLTYRNRLYCWCTLTRACRLTPFRWAHFLCPILVTNCYIFYTDFACLFAKRSVYYSVS